MKKTLSILLAVALLLAMLPTTFAVHTNHTWAYEADGAKLYAWCTNSTDVCATYSKEKKATAELKPVYKEGTTTCTRVEVVVDDKWTSAGLATPEIWYKIGDGAYVKEAVPTEPGTYTAAIMRGTNAPGVSEPATAIATLEYTIGTVNTHNITIASYDTDKATISVDKTQAGFGEEVKVTVTSKPGTYLTSLLYNSTALETKNTFGTKEYTFSMPDSDVTIYANFMQTVNDPLTVFMEVDGNPADKGLAYAAVKDGLKYSVTKNQPFEVTVKVTGDQNSAKLLLYYDKDKVTPSNIDAYSHSTTDGKITIATPLTPDPVDGTCTVAKINFNVKDGVDGGTPLVFDVINAQFSESELAMFFNAVKGVELTDATAPKVTGLTITAPDWLNAAIQVEYASKKVEVSSDIDDAAVEIPDEMYTGKPFTFTLDTHSPDYDPLSVYCFFVTDGKKTGETPHDVALFYGDDALNNYTAFADGKPFATQADANGIVTFTIPADTFDGAVEIKEYKVCKYQISTFNSLNSDKGVDYVPGCSLITVYNVSAGTPGLALTEETFTKVETPGGYPITLGGNSSAVHGDSSVANAFRAGSIGLYLVASTAFTFDGNPMYRINITQYKTDDETYDVPSDLTVAHGLDEFAYIVEGDITPEAAQARIGILANMSMTLSGGAYDLRGGIDANGLNLTTGTANAITSGTDPIGDVNGDKAWDIADVRAAFNCQNYRGLGYPLQQYMATYLRADINRDHTVDATDLEIALVKIAGQAGELTR